MQITVTTESGSILPFDVNLELTLQDLKAILEADVAISASKMVLLHNMEAMKEDRRTLKDYNIQEGDVILVSQELPYTTAHPATNQAGNPAAASSAQTNPSTHPHATPPTQGDDPEVIRRHLLSHPDELALLRERNPPLAQALDSGDPQAFRDTLLSYQRRVADIEQERIRLLNADPLDPNIQARIAQEIQQRNIQENMETAIEFTPENFGRVVMLYVPIKVNGVDVLALVDSGAVSTVMSENCAERCGVMRLVDRRFATVAIGVGTQKVTGKVHLGTIQIGSDMLTASFQVLQNQAEDMLLGLDMLRRHQCCIDLVKNVLRIGTTGSETPFLLESDLKHKEEAMILKKQKLISEGEDAEMARAVATSQEDSKDSSLGRKSAPPPRPAVDQPRPTPPHSSRQASSKEHQSTNQVSQAQQPHPLPTSSSTPSGQQQQQQFPEAAIAQVMAAGFSREQALNALSLCGGNIELALGSLFGNAF